MQCNICGNSRFIDMKNRLKVRCSECHSFERTRLMFMFVQRMDLVNKRILHIAPDFGVYHRLKGLVPTENYVVADFDPERYSFCENVKKIDLCELDEELSNSYDLIIHSHVLEHLPCAFAYTLFHLHRMLTEDGRHLFCVPFMDGNFEESYEPLSDQERSRRFGQFDHLKKFGTKDVRRHLQKIINIPDEYDAREWFEEEELQSANIPRSHYVGYSISSVFCLKKSDYRLRNLITEKNTMGTCGKC